MLIGWDGIVSVSKSRFEKTIKPRIGIEYQSFKNIVAKLVEKSCSSVLVGGVRS